MTPRLVVHELSKHFGGIVAADGVSFELLDAECLGLIGPNGAGKTTVCSIIAGEQMASAGTVRLDGHDLAGLPVYQRARRGLSRTYQRLEIFPEMTVLDHLLVAQGVHDGATGLLGDLMGSGGSSQQQKNAAEETLELVGLGDYADVVVGTLSLGYCRLVELARSLVVNPRVLLADEPSSGLDSLESVAMGDVLQRAQRERGLSIILVEHDLEMVARLSDRVVVMQSGLVVATGSFDEVMADQDVRDAYLGVGK
jgi:branched-chain amino acid transport system ATP-binding protein